MLYVALAQATDICHTAVVAPFIPLKLLFF